MRTPLRRSVLALACIAAAAVLPLASCGGGHRIQTGPDAERSPDGLHKVDGVHAGTLYMQPDYAVGSYHEFVLGKTLVTYQEDAKVLSDEDQAALVEIFEQVATEVIEATGRKRVAQPGPCVAVINLALVDMEISEKQALGGSAGIGAVTLVLEIRDGHTQQPLLRYGSRARLSGASLSAAFKRFANRFEGDFQRSLPDPIPGTTVPCEDRSRATVPIRSE